MNQSIPHYFLYGESTRDVDQHFLHVESITARSQVNEWQIQPHVHAELHHWLLVTNGGGVFHVEGKQLAFAAPTLVTVPVHCVHGFDFEVATDGFVVTVSSALLHRISLAHPEMASVLSEPELYSLSSAQCALFDQKFRALSEEFHSTRVARRAAAESALLSILVAAIRVKTEKENVVARPQDADAELLSRYRRLIEDHFSSRMGAAEYAARLCVSHERLRVACARAAGTSPLALLNARRLLEAKRNLLYTNMSIAVLAHACGFDDPAYFSRFFARSTGQSPRDYRSAHHVAWRKFLPQNASHPSISRSS